MRNISGNICESVNEWHADQQTEVGDPLQVWVAAVFRLVPSTGQNGKGDGDAGVLVLKSSIFLSKSVLCCAVDTCRHQLPVLQFVQPKQNETRNLAGL